MTTATTADRHITVPVVLDMTADQIKTHGLMCGEWQSVSNPKKGCAIGTLRMVCGLPAQWDGFDSTEEQAKERRKYPKRHKLFMGALDTLIAYLGFEYHASDGKTYDGASAVVEWGDSHTKNDIDIVSAPKEVVEAFRKAAKLAQANPEQYEP